MCSSRWKSVLLLSHLFATSPYWFYRPTTHCHCSMSKICNPACLLSFLFLSDCWYRFIVFLTNHLSTHSRPFFFHNCMCLSIKKKTLFSYALPHLQYFCFLQMLLHPTHNSTCSLTINVFLHGTLSFSGAICNSIWCCSIHFNLTSSTRESRELISVFFL